MTQYAPVGYYVGMAENLIVALLITSIFPLIAWITTEGAPRWIRLCWTALFLVAATYIFRGQF